MSKVTTTYDNTLKEKIFIIKGEEGYARSTDCVLTELYTNDGERRSDWNTSLDNMKLEFRINVLRDVGASQVVLYDNDTTIGVYDFDTNAHSIDLKYEGVGEDNRIELSYDVEHHLYAKYMGNKQCMKSQSQSYHLFEPMPDAFKCELSFLDADGFVMNGGINSDYDMLDTIEFKVKLEAEDYISGKTIEVYDGNTLVGEYTTDANGLTELIQIETYDSETDFNGLKKLTARFRGTQYLEAKLTTTNVSVGYTVSVIDYPQYVVNSEPSQVIAKVESYNGNEPSAEMSNNYYAVFQIYRDEEPTGYEKISSSEQPNWDGMIYFDNVVFTKGEFCIRFASPYSFDYISESHTHNIYDNVTVAVSPKQAVTSANNVLPISATLKQNTAPLLHEGIAVDFNGSSILTNANGVATYTYEGNSVGDVSVTASVYSAYDTANIEDVYQYWSKTNGNISIYYRDKFGTTTSQSNGWKCTPFSSGRYGNNLMIFEDNISWEFVVKGVSKLTGIGQDNNPISGIKVGDVIKAVYDVESNYVTFIVNQTTIGSFQYYGNTLSFDFYFADSTGYLTIDEVKIKRSA